jgi:hypothetical protein
MGQRAVWLEIHVAECKRCATGDWCWIGQRIIAAFNVYCEWLDQRKPRVS